MSRRPFAAFLAPLVASLLLVHCNSGDEPAVEASQPPGGGGQSGAGGSTSGVGGTGTAGQSGGAGTAGESGAAGMAGATLGTGSFVLTVDPSGSFTLTGPSGVLVSFPLDALQLGTVDTVSDSYNYDPYNYLKDPPGKLPPGLVWVSPMSASITNANAAMIQIGLTYPGSITATLTLTPTQTGSFTAKLVPTGDGIAVFRIRPRGNATEGFYGLGEFFDDVNQRGKIRPMQLEVDPKNEQGYTTTHVAIPFVIGTTGWGMFIESPYPGVWRVAYDEPDLVDASFAHGSASSKGLTFHLYGAANPLDLTKLYYDDTAYPGMPARWALGPLLWRDQNKDQAQVESDVMTMRTLDLAHTGIWLDRPYATGVETFDFNSTVAGYPIFTDPAHMIDLAHQLGFRVSLWHTPYEDEKDPNTAALVSTLQSSGFYPPTTGITLNGWGRPIDLTNPMAYAWWQQHLEIYENLGIEGYKLDYGEDVVPGVGGVRSTWIFSDGSDERTMMTGFTLLYHQIYREVIPKEGGFLLCRHGVYGDQAHGMVIWPGDLDATFHKAGDMVTETSGNYTAVGGIPAALIAAITTGPSGFPVFAADTGGYLHSPPTKEVFSRSLEATTVGTGMEVGNASDTVAWEPDATTGFDAEMLGWYQTYTRLHVRLFPYVWSYLTKVATDGRAIQRPFGLVHPELGQHPNDEYFLGDWLLSAPVIEEGATSRSVMFPPGKWVNWFTGEAHQGPTTDTVQATLGELPLYLGEGGIVPLLRPTIDAMAPTTMPDLVDSYATTPGVLWPRVMPGPSSSFTLFDGAKISQTTSGTTTTLTVADGTEFTNGWVIELLAQGTAPTAVTLDGAPLSEVADTTALDAATTGYAFDGTQGGRVFAKVGAGAHTIVIGGP